MATFISKIINQNFFVSDSSISPITQLQPCAVIGSYLQPLLTLQLLQLIIILTATLQVHIKIIILWV